MKREVVRFFRSHGLLAWGGAAILALGIGASTLAFALLWTFSSLSFSGLRGGSAATVAEEANSGGGLSVISFERFERVRESSSPVASLALYSRVLPLAPGSPAIAAVSAGLFTNFTEPLLAGRDFTLSEEERENSQVVLVSSALAVRNFGSPATALGRTVMLKGRPFEVIGVAPRSFAGMFGEVAEVWVPAHAIVPLALEGPGGSSWKVLNLFFALATGGRRVPTARLVQDLKATLPVATGEEGRLQVWPGFTDDPVRDGQLRARFRLGLTLSLAFTVITGLNLAWLLLAQTPRQAQEIYLKVALGADTARIIRGALAGPSALLALGFLGAAAVVGCGMAVIGSTAGIEGLAVRGSWPTAMMAYGLAFPFAVVLTGCIVALPIAGLVGHSFGHMPGGHTPGGQVPGRYRHTGSYAVRALMTVPVVMQVSLAVVTCILAGMVTAALLAEINEFHGYDASELTTVTMGPASGSIRMSWSGSEVSRTMVGLSRLMVRARSMPGVRAAAYASTPVGGRGGGAACWLERTDAGARVRATVEETVVSPGYFGAIGGVFVEGRDFPDGGGGDEVILNRSAAQLLWREGNRANRRVRVALPSGSGLPSSSYTATVAGVVEDLKPPGQGRHATPALYTSMFKKGVQDFSPKVVLNGVVSWQAVEAALGQEVRAELPGMEILSVDRVQDRIRAVLKSDAIGTYLALGGALLMAVVSAIGLFASLTYFITSRRRELAIRVCLGATEGSIRRLLYGRALFSVCAGAVLSVPLWPLLSGLSTVEYLGGVSWSTSRAVAIVGVLAGLSTLLARLAAGKATWLSPAQLAKEE